MTKKYITLSIDKEITSEGLRQYLISKMKEKALGQPGFYDTYELAKVARNNTLANSEKQLLIVECEFDFSKAEKIKITKYDIIENKSQVCDFEIERIILTRLATQNSEMQIFIAAMYTLENKHNVPWAKDYREKLLVNEKEKNEFLDKAKDDEECVLFETYLKSFNEVKSEQIKEEKPTDEKHAKEKEPVLNEQATPAPVVNESDNYVNIDLGDDEGQKQQNVAFPVVKKYIVFSISKKDELFDPNLKEAIKFQTENTSSFGDYEVAKLAREVSQRNSPLIWLIAECEFNTSNLTVIEVTGYYNNDGQLKPFAELASEKQEPAKEEERGYEDPEEETALFIDDLYKEGRDDEAIESLSKILDKFVPDEQNPTALHRAINKSNDYLVGFYLKNTSIPIITLKNALEFAKQYSAGYRNQYEAVPDAEEAKKASFLDWTLRAEKITKIIKLALEEAIHTSLNDAIEKSNLEKVKEILNDEGVKALFYKSFNGRDFILRTQDNIERVYTNEAKEIRKAVEKKLKEFETTEEHKLFKTAYDEFEKNKNEGNRDGLVEAAILTRMAEEADKGFIQAKDFLFDYYKFHYTKSADKNKFKETLIDIANIIVESASDRKAAALYELAKDYYANGERDKAANNLKQVFRLTQKNCEEDKILRNEAKKFIVEKTDLYEELKVYFLKDIDKLQIKNFIDTLNKNSLTPYSLIQIDKNATTVEINKEFIKITLAEHPDKETGSNNYSWKTTAIEYLRDKEKRAYLDSLLPGDNANTQKFTGPNEAVRPQLLSRTGTLQNLVIPVISDLKRTRRMGFNEGEKQKVPVMQQPKAESISSSEINAELDKLNHAGDEYKRKLDELNEKKKTIEKGKEEINKKLAKLIANSDANDEQHKKNVNKFLEIKIEVLNPSENNVNKKEGLPKENEDQEDLNAMLRKYQEKNKIVSKITIVQNFHNLHHIIVSSLFPLYSNRLDDNDKKTVCKSALDNLEELDDGKVEEGSASHASAYRVAANCILSLMSELSSEKLKYSLACFTEAQKLIKSKDAGFASIGYYYLGIDSSENGDNIEGAIEYFKKASATEAGSGWVEKYINACGYETLKKQWDLSKQESKFILINDSEEKDKQPMPEMDENLKELAAELRDEAEDIKDPSFELILDSCVTILEFGNKGKEVEDAKKIWYLEANKLLMSEDNALKTKGYYYLGLYWEVIEKNPHLAIGNFRAALVASKAKGEGRINKCQDKIREFNTKNDEYKNKIIKDLCDYTPKSVGASFWFHSRNKTLGVMIEQINDINPKLYNPETYKKLVLSVLEQRYQFLPESSKLSKILERILLPELGIHHSPGDSSSALAKKIYDKLYTNFEYPIFKEDGNVSRGKKKLPEVFNYKKLNSADPVNPIKELRKNTIADLYGYIDSRETGFKYKFLMKVFGENCESVKKIKNKIAYAYKLIDEIENGSQLDIDKMPPKPEGAKADLIVGSDLEKILFEYRNGSCSIRPLI